MPIRVFALVAGLVLAATLPAQTERFVPAQFPTIQAAITAAAPGDIIRVSPGTYNESFPSGFSGKPLALVGSGATGCIIDATGMNAPVFGFATSHPNSIIEGFTITGGTFGGINLDVGSVTVQDCTITGNSHDTGNGGGIRSELGELRLIGCEISNNTCNGDGGGVYHESPVALLMYDCDVHGNDAGGRGGGVYVATLAANTIENCAVWNNMADTGGGGVFIDDPASGPALAANLNHLTVHGNQTLAGNGGVAFNGGVGQLRNSIVRGNTPVANQLALGSAGASHSNVEGAATGVGNIDADPLFTNAGAGDFTLMVGSPSIDTGAGVPDPDGSAPDMGRIGGYLALRQSAAFGSTGYNPFGSGGTWSQVLSVDGQSPAHGRVDVAVGSDLVIAVGNPVFGPGENFALMVHQGLPAAELMVGGIGLLTFDPFVPQALLLTDNIGAAPGFMPSTPAPWSGLVSGGAPVPMRFVIQGGITQFGALRTTNAILVNAF